MTCEHDVVAQAEFQELKPQITEVESPEQAAFTTIPAGIIPTENHALMSSSGLAFRMTRSVKGFKARGGFQADIDIVGWSAGVSRSSVRPGKQVCDKNGPAASNCVAGSADNSKPQGSRSDNV
jgi:hypothetical protein